MTKLQIYKTNHNQYAFLDFGALATSDQLVLVVNILPWLKCLILHESAHSEVTVKMGCTVWNVQLQSGECFVHKWHCYSYPLYDEGHVNGR